MTDPLTKLVNGMTLREFMKATHLPFEKALALLMSDKVKQYTTETGFRYKLKTKETKNAKL